MPGARIQREGARLPGPPRPAPGTLAALAGSALLLVVFLRVQAQRENPLVALRVFRNRSFAGATLSNFLVNGVMGGTTMVVMALMQQAAGWSSFEAGLLTIGYLVAVLVTIRQGERTMQRIGSRVPMLASVGIAGVGVALLAVTVLRVGEYVVVAVLGFTLFGLGLGLYATPSTDTALENVPPALTGQASGVDEMASSLGDAIVVAAVVIAVAIPGALEEVRIRTRRRLAKDRVVLRARVRRRRDRRALRGRRAATERPGHRFAHHGSTVVGGTPPTAHDDDDLAEFDGVPL